mgnify:CR=1 FL=1
MLLSALLVMNISACVYALENEIDETIEDTTFPKLTAEEIKITDAEKNLCKQWLEENNIPYGINTNFNIFKYCNPNYLKISLDGYDLVTNFTASLTCISTLSLRPFPSRYFAAKSSPISPRRRFSVIKKSPSVHLFKESQTVYLAGTEFSQFFIMELRSVPFMFCKTIFRIFFIHFEHEPVPAHFCKNGCCRNAVAFGVAANDSAGRNLKISCNVSVDKCIIRLYRKAVNGAAHCKKGSVQNIQFIDLCLT